MEVEYFLVALLGDDIAFVLPGCVDDDVRAVDYSLNCLLGLQGSPQIQLFTLPHLLGDGVAEVQINDLFGVLLLFISEVEVALACLLRFQCELAACLGLALLEGGSELGLVGGEYMRESLVIGFRGFGE